MQAMKDGYRIKPELFKKQPYYLTECDTYHLEGGHQTEAKVTVGPKPSIGVSSIDVGDIGIKQI